MNALAWILFLGSIGADGDLEPRAPYQLSWGDADLDGLLDALVLSPAGELHLLWNRGGGRFQGEREPLAGLRGVRSVAWGDLDRLDGPDLLVLTEDGRLELLVHRPGGTFDVRSLEAELGPLTEVGWIDLDQDGWSDLLLAGPGGRRFVLRNREGKIDEEPLGLGLVGASVPAEMGAGAAGPPRPGAKNERPPIQAPGNSSQPVPSLSPGSRRSLAPSPRLSSSGTCADSIADQAGSGCLVASSVPLIGALYPLQTAFFIDGVGNVGLGTLNPVTRLDVNGDDLLVEEGDLELHDGPRKAIAVEPAALSLNNGSGLETLRLDVPTTGTVLSLSNDGGAETVRLDSVPNTGTLSLRNGSGAEKLLLEGGAGQGAELGLRNASGVETVTLDGDTGDVGRMTLRNSTGSTRVVAGTGSDGAGFANVYGASNLATVNLDASYTQGQGSMWVRNSLGTGTVFFNADSHGGGFVSVREQLLGGSEVQLQGKNEAGFSQIGLTGSDGSLTVALVNTGALFLYEQDGSLAFRMSSNWLTLHNSAGSTTQSYNRITGSKSAVVDAGSAGRRLMYAIESPGVWFQDSGSARLDGAATRIDLDPVFLETVSIDERHPMQVSVTLTGPSPGVFVEKGLDHFIVRELPGGDAQACFDWRVAAKRRGLEDKRLDACQPDWIEADPQPVVEQR